MKNMKRIEALLLAVMLLCSIALMSACGDSASNSKEAAYKVMVVDAVGNPYASGVIVRFMQNGEQVALQPITEAGVAEKTMARGDYTVELMFTDDDGAYYYDKTDLALSSDKTELQIVLTYATGEDAQTLHVQGSEKQAFPVGVGSTYVKLTAGERSYFLFTPTVAGTYKFSVDAEGTQIGYYGAPHFVQDMSAAEVVDNAFSISVKAAMIGTSNAGTSVFVIGIDSQSAENAVLNIERTGDPEWTIEDEPWTVYEAKTQISEYVLPAGAKTVKFDIKAATDAYNLVLNETDGYYHLNSADGPLVLFNLGEKSGGGAPYLDSFQTILDHSGIAKYFFDENGEFVKKESYSECLLKYIECMDEEAGLYPLTEDLKYILQQRGEYVGWFAPDSDMYLFVDNSFTAVPGVNNEISWLFMCSYIDE